MRNPFLRHLEIAINRSVLTVSIRRGRQAAIRLSELPLADLGPAEISVTLEQALDAAHPAAAMARIVLADTLVRLFTVTPPRNARIPADLQAAAALRFRMLYDAAPKDWHISADWDACRPFIACALPAQLACTLAEVASRHRLTLTEVVPHLIASWNRWHSRLKPGAWFAVAHDGGLALAPCDRAAMRALRQLPLPAHTWPGDAWLAATVRREALRLALPQPRLVQVCGELPAEWEGSNADNLGLQRLDTAAAVSFWPHRRRNAEA
jgi:hypothetical protein